MVLLFSEGCDGGIEVINPGAITVNLARLR